MAYDSSKAHCSPQVTQTQHAQLMNDLNKILAAANDPYRAIFDNCLAILSLYLSTFLYKSYYERVSVFRQLKCV